MKLSLPPPVVVFPGLAAAILLLGAAAFFSGCYTLTQGSAMLGYLNRAVPLEEVPDEVFTARIQDIRRFAREDLGLRDTPNYTKYVEIDRDYLAAIVSASAKDSFTTYHWWFPVVGSVPYKGFFEVKGARKEAEKLRKKDLDVWVRQVDAFSTLGWFKDPLYSYMKNYSVHALADLIIHETLHATIYLPSQSQFNEELAEFIGSQGARLYVEKIFGPDSEEYQNIDGTKNDQAAFIAFIQGLIAELDALYQSPLNGPGGREEKLVKKEEIIRAAQIRFDAEYDDLFQSDNYRGFSRMTINNAYLDLYRLYYAGASWLEDLYNRSGRNLPRFIAAAKTITKKGGPPRTQLEKALGLVY
ncbi:aminopeptidase [Spirochaetia bacterium]|nr:aminopeptidase [Spirochaetia bacterium]